ncbi:MAG: hypothetical protein B6229_09180 [Spirochaetaceae bacterium 4572_7]|nr:MAG: hypothetical protein B6229_09180 [Spirochaetaceae bacterium 4572_7]
MNKLRLKAWIKIVIIISISLFFIQVTTNWFSQNIIYQISIFTLFIFYYLIIDRSRLKTLLDIAKFLTFMIILLHSIFFIIKWVTINLDDTISYYKIHWISLVVRIFIIPNIFAFFDIITSRISFIDITLLSKNSKKAKIVYILLISAIEVMERLRIYFEYHPLNHSHKTMDKIVHYLAVPLTLFFGIYRGFEKKIEIIENREDILTKRE